MGNRLRPRHTPPWYNMARAWAQDGPQGRRFGRAASCAGGGFADEDSLRFDPDLARSVTILDFGLSRSLSFGRLVARRPLATRPRLLDRRLAQMHCNIGGTHPRQRLQTQSGRCASEYRP